MRIVFAPASLRDIEATIAYIRVDSEFHALRWRDRLLSAIDTLKQQPKRGYPLLIDEVSDCRVIRVGRYRVIYRLREDRIEILRVRHPSQLTQAGDVEG